MINTPKTVCKHGKTVCKHGKTVCKHGKTVCKLKHGSSMDNMAVQFACIFW